MALDGNKALSRRALEMWASGSSDDLNEIFTTNYMNYQEPAAAGGVRGLNLQSWFSVVRGHHEAFPDTVVDILLQIAEDGLVATHWRFSATDTGGYLGNPATGKKVSWTGVQIDRFEDGKIVESWVCWDKFSQFESLGLVN